MNKIQRKRESIKNKIYEWKHKLKKLQEECPHTNLSKKHRADTGNYDPSCDCYWTEFECHDCGKFWSEDGSK